MLQISEGFCIWGFQVTVYFFVSLRFCSRPKSIKYGLAEPLRVLTRNKVLTHAAVAASGWVEGSSRGTQKTTLCALLLYRSDRDQISGCFGWG